MPSREVGSSTQAQLLASKMKIPIMAPEPVAGSGNLIETDAHFGKLYYPVVSPLRGLEELDPDLVVVHTLSPDVLNHLNEISSRWPTLLRIGANLQELSLSPVMRNHISLILYALESVDCVVCPALHVERDLNALGVHHTKVIPTAVDTELFKPSERPPEDDLVVSIGRLAPIKNTLTAILAMRGLANRMPTLKYEVYGTGEMFPVLANMLRNMATVADFIELKGWERARDVLGRAKAFLQLSYSENQSSSVLEAMASGVPVVASDIPGHAVGQIRDWSLRSVRDEVERLLTDDDYWHERRNAGLEEVKKYDVKKVIPMYRELFADMLKLKEFKGELRR